MLAEWEKTYKEFHPKAMCLHTVARGRGCIKRECLYKSELIHGADHTSFWKHKEKGHVVAVTQPYDLNNDDLRELVKACDALELRVHIDGNSWWMHGHTSCVTIQAGSTI